MDNEQYVPQLQIGVGQLLHPDSDAVTEDVDRLTVRCVQLVE